MNRISYLAEENVDESILLSAIKLQKALTDFLRISVLWLDVNYTSKIAATAIGSQDVQAEVTTPQRAQGALRTSISDDLYLTVKRQSIESHNEQSLSNVCPYEDHVLHIAKQKQLCQDRLPNTGAGIIDGAAYQRWCTGETSTLWCSGLAGAGKTFAASAVIDDLELRFSGSNVGLAYFYCEFDLRQKHGSACFISAVARQLMARNPSLCAKLSKKPQVLDLKER